MKSGLRFQLIILNLLLIIFPLLVSSIISFSKYRESMMNSVSKYSLRVVKQLNNNIDIYLEDMINISVLPMYDRDIQSILRGKENLNYVENEYVKAYSDEKLRNFLFTVNNLRTEISGVFIYNNSGQVFYNARGGIVEPKIHKKQYDCKKSDWYKTAKLADGKSVIINTHIQEQVANGNDQVFSVAKIIKDINTGNEIGAILIDVNLDKIDEICKSVLYNEQESVVILDQSGQVVHRVGDDEGCNFILKNSADLFYNKQGFQTGKYQNEAFLLTYNASMYSEWKVVWAAPNAQLFKDTQILRALTYFIVLVSALFAVLLLFFVSNQIVSPLKKLIKQVKLIESGNLDAKVKFKSLNEVGVLAQSFNVMADKIKHLIYEIYEVKLQKKEAQLRALQYQINPHFLYNTLESIHMITEINQDFKASKMITSLSKILRYSIYGEKDFATIGDEISHLNNYIYIQQIRYENKFKFFTSIDPMVVEFSILRLTLQPLVENCIYHALKEKRTDDGYILINALKEDDNIVIKIIDNGVGIAPERLELIRKQLDNYLNSDYEYENIKSIGIHNVNKRIKMFFGDQYGVWIQSSLAVGTEVTLTIPAMKIKNGVEEADV